MEERLSYTIETMFSVTERKIADLRDSEQILFCITTLGRYRTELLGLKEAQRLERAKELFLILLNWIHVRQTIQD